MNNIPNSSNLNQQSGNLDPAEKLSGNLAPIPDSSSEQIQPKTVDELVSFFDYLSLAEIDEIDISKIKEYTNGMPLEQITEAIDIYIKLSVDFISKYYEESAYGMDINSKDYKEHIADKAKDVLKKGDLKIKLISELVTNRTTQIAEIQNQELEKSKTEQKGILNSAKNLWKTAKSFPNNLTKLFKSKIQEDLIEDSSLLQINPEDTQAQLDNPNPTSQLISGLDSPDSALENLDTPDGAEDLSNIDISVLELIGETKNEGIDAMSNISPENRRGIFARIQKGLSKIDLRKVDWKAVGEAAKVVGNRAKENKVLLVGTGLATVYVSAPLILSVLATTSAATLGVGTFGSLGLGSIGGAASVGGTPIIIGGYLVKTAQVLSGVATVVAGGSFAHNVKKLFKKPSEFEAEEMAQGKSMEKTKKTLLDNALNTLIANHNEMKPDKQSIVNLINKEINALYAFLLTGSESIPSQINVGDPIPELFTKPDGSKHHIANYGEYIITKNIANIKNGEYIDPKIPKIPANTVEIDPNLSGDLEAFLAEPTTPQTPVVPTPDSIDLANDSEMLRITENKFQAKKYFDIIQNRDLSQYPSLNRDIFEVLGHNMSHIKQDFIDQSVEGNDLFAEIQKELGDFDFSQIGNPDIRKTWDDTGINMFAEGARKVLEKYSDESFENNQTTEVSGEPSSANLSQPSDTRDIDAPLKSENLEQIDQRHLDEFKQLILANVKISLDPRYFEASPVKIGKTKEMMGKGLDFGMKLIGKEKIRTEVEITDNDRKEIDIIIVEQLKFDTDYISNNIVRDLEGKIEQPMHISITSEELLSSLSEAGLPLIRNQNDDYFVSVDAYASHVVDKIKNKIMFYMTLAKDGVTEIKDTIAIADEEARIDNLNKFENRRENYLAKTSKAFLDGINKKKETSPLSFEKITFIALGANMDKFKFHYSENIGDGKHIFDLIQEKLRPDFNFQDIGDKAKREDTQIYSTDDINKFGTAALEVLAELSGQPLSVQNDTVIQNTSSQISDIPDQTIESSQKPLDTQEDLVELDPTDIQSIEPIDGPTPNLSQTQAPEINPVLDAIDTQMETPINLEEIKQLQFLKDESHRLLTQIDSYGLKNNDYGALNTRIFQVFCENITPMIYNANTIGNTGRGIFDEIAASANFSTVELTHLAMPENRFIRLTATDREKMVISIMKVLNKYKDLVIPEPLEISENLSESATNAVDISDPLDSQGLNSQDIWGSIPSNTISSDLEFEDSEPASIEQNSDIFQGELVPDNTIEKSDSSSLTQAKASEILDRVKVMSPTQNLKFINDKFGELDKLGVIAEIIAALSEASIFRNTRHLKDFSGKKSTPQGLQELARVTNSILANHTNDITFIGKIDETPSEEIDAEIVDGNKNVANMSSTQAKTISDDLSLEPSSQSQDKNADQNVSAAQLKMNDNSQETISNVPSLNQYQLITMSEFKQKLNDTNLKDNKRRDISVLNYLDSHFESLLDPDAASNPSFTNIHNSINYIKDSNTLVKMINEDDNLDIFEILKNPIKLDKIISDISKEWESYDARPRFMKRFLSTDSETVQSKATLQYLNALEKYMKTGEVPLFDPKA